MDYLDREILNQQNPKRNPFIGTVDQVGNDRQRIGETGVKLVNLHYNFSADGREMSKIIQLTKQLRKFAS